MSRRSTNNASTTTCCGRCCTTSGGSICWSRFSAPSSHRRWARGSTRCTTGFGVAGINWPIFWAFYITNFVFWIGISHAGTLISAILRLVNADVAAAGHALRRSDHGLRADDRRAVSDHSPGPAVAVLLADSVSEPAADLAEFPFAAGVGLLRDHDVSDRQPAVPVPADDSRLRARCAITSTGLATEDLRHAGARLARHDKQWHRLEAAMQIMAIAIIPVAVSVHTIVSFDFSMAPVPMWHSTIFGPYFVAGAIFSGIAGADHRDGGAAQVPAPRGIPAPAALPESRQAAADDEPVVGILRRSSSGSRSGTATSRAEMAVFWATQSGSVCAALLDDGDLQFRHPVSDLSHQEDCARSPAASSRPAASSSACGSNAS